MSAVLPHDMDRDGTAGGFEGSKGLLEHAGWVRALARALVRDPSAAEDVAQDAWLAALRRAPSDGAPLKPWLARIVHNLATDHARTESRRAAREAVHASGRDAAQDTPDEVAASIETQKALLAAVERLTEPLRSAVVRRYFHGRTSVEIAAEDGVGESTVRERIQRGLESLRRDLDRSHRGDRHAWMAALAPIAGTARAASPGVPPATTGTAAGWGIVMGIAWKLGLALTLAAVAVVVTSKWLDPPLAEPIAATRAHPLPDLAPHVDPATRARVASTRESALAATDTEITLAPSALPQNDLPAIVTARIVDPDGIPLAGAEFTCTSCLDRGDPGHPEAHATLSTADGRVRYAVRRSDSPAPTSASTSDDSWIVRFEASAVGLAPRSVEVRVRAGETSACGDVVLVEAGGVRGRVVDEQGNGLSDVVVRIVLPDLTLDERARAPWSQVERPGPETKSGADGEFLIEVVPVGSYRAWARLTGRLNAVSEWFEVRAGETTHVRDLSMHENVNAIRGVVLGADGRATKRTVWYAPTASSLDAWLGQDTKPDGTFVIDVRPDARIDLHCENMTSEGSTGVHRKSVPAGTRGLVLRMAPLPTVDVVVQDERGVPVDACNVSIVESTNRNGMSLLSLRGSRHRIPTSCVPFTIKAGAFGFRTTALGPFEPGSVPAELVITLERTARLRGRVTAGGEPVSRARVSLLLPLQAGSFTSWGFPQRLTWTEAMQAETEGDGSFALPHTTNSLRIPIVEADGFATRELAPVVMNPHDDVTLDVELASGGRLEGRVRDYDPAVSTVQFVSASRGDARVWSTRIASDGSFAFDNLTPGEWWVRPTEHDRSDSFHKSSAPPDPANRRVDIVEGSTTRLLLDAPAKQVGTLEGRLHLPGVDETPWTVRLWPDDERWELTTRVQADGTFRFELPQTGKHHLRLRTPSNESLSISVDCELDLVAGSNAWALEVELGMIDVASATVRDVEIEWRSPTGVTWSAQWRLGSADRNILACVPSGSVTISAAGRVLAEVQVQAGRATTVTW